MADAFAQFSSGLESPAIRIHTVSPSDTTDLIEQSTARPQRSLWPQAAPFRYARRGFGPPAQQRQISSHCPERVCLNTAGRPCPMIAISLGLTDPVSSFPNLASTLVITNLTDGMARSGDELGVNLPGGPQILTYAWGSAPGADDYGTGANLIVPAAADGSTLFVSVTTASGSYATSAPVQSGSSAQTLIAPGIDMIEVLDLAPAASLPALVLFTAPDTINVEIA